MMMNDEKGIIGRFLLVNLLQRSLTPLSSASQRKVCHKTRVWLTPAAVPPASPQHIITSTQHRHSATSPQPAASAAEMSIASSTSALIRMHLSASSDQVYEWDSDSRLQGKRTLEFILCTSTCKHTLAYTGYVMQPNTWHVATWNGAQIVHHRLSSARIRRYTKSYIYIVGHGCLLVRVLAL